MHRKKEGQRDAHKRGGLMKALKGDGGGRGCHSMHSHVPKHRVSVNTQTKRCMGGYAWREMYRGMRVEGVNDL